MHGRCARLPALGTVLAILGAVAVLPPQGAAADTSGSGAGAAAGSIGIRLLDAPDSERDDPRARLYIIDHLHPGAVIHRRLGISNATRQTVRPTIYADAADIEKGSFVGAQGATRNELTTWIHLGSAQLDLAPGAERTDQVTISVPRDASSGERYAVIWAQATSAPQAGSSVTVVNRVGIRVYLSIGPGGAPPSRFRIRTLTATRLADGRPQVVAQVTNTGGRALDISGTLRLRDGPGGLSAGPFPARLGTTLALGDTEPVTIPLDRQLPDGPWRADLTLRSGLTQETATATIRFPGEPGARTSTAHAPSTRSPWWPLLLGTGAAAVLLFLLVVLARRRRKRDDGAAHGDTTVPHTA